MARSSEGKLLLKKLICLTTGFDKEDDNFATCLNYAASNLRFHRYLDVDRHKVTQTLDGLFEKFAIHSSTHRGSLLSDKVSQFLNSHEFEKKDSGFTDTHYAVLSLVLDMSNSPTSQLLTDHTQPTVDISSSESFDWFTYLTEDLPALQTDFSDSTVDSDDDAQSEQRSTIELNETACHFDMKSYVNVTRDALCDTLITPYWCGEQDPRLRLHSDLTDDWNCYLARMGRLDSSGYSDTYMSEYQIVREMLWLLSGSTELFLFRYDTDDSSFTVRTGISLTHTTKDSISSLLLNFLKFGNQLCQLRRFALEYVSMSSDYVMCHTYQAFCVAVLDIVRQLDDFNSETQRLIKSGGLQATALMVSRRYEPHRQTVAVLHSILTSAVMASHNTSASPSLAASTLLHHCNRALDDVCLLTDKMNLVMVTLMMFIKTLKPYVDLIDDWLTRGELNDPHGEFIIRKKSLGSLDETFWNEAVETVTSAEDEFEYSGGVPCISKGTISKVASAGKSVEMLSRLGKLNQVLGLHNKPLHQVLIDNLCTELGNDLDNTDSVAKSTDSGVVSPSLVNDHNDQHSTDKSAYECLSKCLCDLGEGSIRNLTRMISTALDRLISQRQEYVAGHLLTVLRHDYKLHRDLALVEKAYLFEAGDVLYDFTWDLFNKVRDGVPWCDSLALNACLQEPLHKLLPYDDVTRFSIHLSDIKRSQLLPIHAFEQIHLSMHTGWPVNVLITSEYRLQFSRVFQFLLQLKFSKHCLDQLKFDDLAVSTEERAETADVETEDVEAVTHSMCVMRLRLLHVINGIHDYIMTNVLPSAKLDLQRGLEAAVEMESLLLTYKKFVSQLVDKCFLHENSAVLRDCVLRLLNCAVEFHHLWQCQALDVRDALRDLSDMFVRCLHVLSSLLTSALKASSLFHLEYLLSSLHIALEES